MATAKKSCTNCQTQGVEQIQEEEFNFAVLVSMIPLLVFTLFGQFGLF